MVGTLSFFNMYGLLLFIPDDDDKGRGARSFTFRNATLVQEDSFHPVVRGLASNVVRPTSLLLIVSTRTSSKYTFSSDDDGVLNLYTSLGTLLRREEKKKNTIVRTGTTRAGIKEDRDANKRLLTATTTSQRNGSASSILFYLTEINKIDNYVYKTKYR
ncbi:hypothetical protein ACJX0J_028338 [Zea mays]